MYDTPALHRHGNEKARIDNTVDAGPMRLSRLRAAIRSSFVPLPDRNT
ncbi:MULTISPECIES: hypothetical protein [Burkholderia]|nr:MULTISPECIES: hypothetical protein [Burkholderia]ELK6465226.1 hypothetical protein [Burkholderia contaminans]MCA7883527.1 hypothetical protein [Burkholderia contaminans]HEM7876387.1 hypothetical protein [Burkholderia contaminans]